MLPAQTGMSVLPSPECGSAGGQPPGSGAVAGSPAAIVPPLFSGPEVTAHSLALCSFLARAALCSLLLPWAGGGVCPLVPSCSLGLCFQGGSARRTCSPGVPQVCMLGLLAASVPLKLLALKKKEAPPPSLAPRHWGGKAAPASACRLQGRCCWWRRGPGASVLSGKLKVAGVLGKELVCT